MLSPSDLRSLLGQLASGTTQVDEVVAALAAPGQDYAAVSDFAQVDISREQRTGIPEFIFSPGKTPEQIVAIARRMAEAGKTNILATKANPAVAAALQDAFPDAVLHPISRIVVVHPRDGGPLLGDIAVVTGGTSDLPAAEETELVCRILGSKTTRFADIGIACISRALDVVPSLQRMNVIVCAAGMEAALPSVLAGLVSVPVIAVPTSVGYGVNTGGFNALLSVLGGCVPGVLAVNIDNGVGAAVAAHRINLLAARGAV